MEPQALPAAERSPVPAGAAAAPVSARPVSAKLDRTAAGAVLRFPVAEAVRRPGARGSVATSGLDGWSDEELIRGAQGDPEAAPRCLDALFRRHQRRVAAWCLRWANGRAEDAADLAQEVFLRAQEKLAGFRFQSAFTTWLYLVTRTVALNRADAARRRPADSLEERQLDPADPATPVDEAVARDQQVALLRAAVATVLEPLEARVLHLHFTEGLTLAAIDALLGLDNKSGAKAYIVAARRKLRRHFERGTTGAEAPVEEDA